MSDPGLSFEEAHSPDVFDDAVNNMRNNPINWDDSNSMSVDVNEPEPIDDDTREWRGTNMDEIRKGLGVYDYQELPPIWPSSTHTVLALLPLPARGTPKPYPTHPVDKWSKDYVRMPHSKRCSYLIDENGTRRYRIRWNVIQEALLQNFVSTQQLESAIFSYNHTYAQTWDFSALHTFFAEVVDEEEANIFFETLMPKMVQLALQLPVLITGPIPLLKRHSNGTISLSQLQIACLLANAFFCTFPRRNSINPQSEYGRYPFINFNRLFSIYKREKGHKLNKSLMEKIKCIFHYFRRVTSKAPEGMVTIQRRHIPKSDCPNWNEEVQKLLPLHVTSRGTIETEGAGLLQVDFANKCVGGGVLGYGCVQEEIRFMICPELIVTMLVTEHLDDTEALIVCGVERYSKYKGYSTSFRWLGDFVDETPRDSSGRRKTSIVAIDALYFPYSQTQFSMNKVTRELDKAYVGFVGCEGNKNNLPPVGTGNWGCGAFHGDPKLKALIQLMAAAVTGRSMVYFTFGDSALRDEIAEMYMHLVKHELTIGQIYSLLRQYREYAPTAHVDLYSFIYDRTQKLNKTPSQKINKDVRAKCFTPKEAVFNRNKGANSGEKRSVRLDIRNSQHTEEERIEMWLNESDDDVANKEKTNTPVQEYLGVRNTVEQQSVWNKDGAKRKEQIQDDKEKTEEELRPYLAGNSCGSTNFKPVITSIYSYTTKELVKFPSENPTSTCKKDDSPAKKVG